MIRPRHRAAQQRRGRESAHSLGSILSRAYAAPVLQPPHQACLSPRIAAASKRPKSCLTLGKSTAVAAAAVAAACSPTAGRRHRTRRCGHWGNSAYSRHCSPSPKHTTVYLLQCKAKSVHGILYVLYAISRVSIALSMRRSSRALHTRRGHRGSRGAGRGRANKGACRVENMCAERISRAHTALSVCLIRESLCVLEYRVSENNSNPPPHTAPAARTDSGARGGPKG